MKSLKEKLEVLKNLGFQILISSINTTTIRIGINFPNNSICSKWNELTKHDLVPNFTIGTRLYCMTIDEVGIKLANEWVNSIYNEYEQIQKIIHIHNELNKEIK